MAKGTFTNRSGFANDAEFRVWGQKISDIFAACGLVKHWANFDWATVLKPTNPNNSTNQEIWRFDDSLQATKPVFIKLWFGTSQSYDYLGGLWVQISNGADGSGNLNGTVISMQRKIQFGATTSNWDQTDWANIWSGGEGNRLFMMLNYDSDWLNQGYINGGLCIERTRNADGTVNGDALAMFCWHYTSAPNQGYYESNQVLDFVDVIAHNFNTRVAAMNVLRTDFDATFYNGFVSTIPVYPCKLGSLLYNPMLTMLACYDRDFVNDITTKITHYGIERTYLKIGYGGEFWKWNVYDQNRGRTRGLLLWE